MKNGIVVLAVAVLTAPGSACTREGKTLLGPVSERVEVFIVAQGLPTVRGYDEVLVDSERDLLLFRVRYGEASDCLPGYTTITHVEPEQSHQIRYADPPADSLGPIEPILVLSAFSRDAREVDWAPAAVDLRAILDGTSLDAFTEILEILARTSVSVDLAEDLLAGGGEMVLAHLRASHPHLRELARRFLVTISGRDYGEDAIRWGEWIESLGEGSPATSTDEKG